MGQILCLTSDKVAIKTGNDNNKVVNLFGTALLMIDQIFTSLEIRKKNQQNKMTL